MNDIKEIIGKGDYESAQQKQGTQEMSEDIRKEIDALKKQIEEREENEYQ